MNIPPLFDVYSVEDGGSFGILIRKQYADGRVKRAYFYLDNPEGLRLTREVLHDNKIIEVKLAQRKYHEKLLKELKAYAHASNDTGDISATRQLSQNYRGKEDFGAIIGRIFDRGDEILADFLEGRDLFKDRVLEKTRNRSEVKGKARYFGVTSPDRLIPDERLQCLRPIRDVLEIYEQSLKPENAQWFRRRGPIAADFVYKKFYLRQEALEQLETLVLGNPVSLFQGDPATGKTVLALNLAYELYHKKKQVYYFDFDKERDFNRSALVNDIRKIKGVIIIENIHLDPAKFEPIYSTFKNDRDRHILFTARGTYRDCSSSAAEYLAEIKMFPIGSVGNTKQLIDAFCLDNKIPLPSPNVRDQIEEISGSNLWLLAYALKGYLEEKDQGNPKGWIRDSIRVALQDLEDTCPDYPEILLALSVLYREEILTAEDYLTEHLCFDVHTLNTLVKRGEITKQETPDGYVFYGLLHSKLADAYWTFGDKYKRRLKISKYEDFLYGYACSGAPNAIEAILQAEDNITRNITTRLAVKGELADTIINETSTWTVARWVARANTRIVADASILASLAKKLELHDDAEYVSKFMENVYDHGQEVWTNFCALLDDRKLVDRMVSTKGPTSVACSICSKLLYGDPLARKLYSRLNLKELIYELNQTSDLFVLGQCVRVVYKMDAHADSAVSSKLDWKKVASHLSTTEDLWAAKHCIDYFLAAKPAVARRFCKLLCLKDLSARIESRSIWSASELIASIFIANSEVGRRLWDACKQSIANKIYQPNQSFKDHAFWTIYNANNKMGRELVDLVDIDKLVVILSDPKNLENNVKSALAIRAANKKRGRGLWNRYANNLTELWNQGEKLRQMSQCITDIGFQWPEMATKVCRSLKAKKLANKLNEFPDLWIVIGTLIPLLLRYNPSVGRKLWSSLDFNRHRPLPNIFLDIGDGLRSIRTIQSEHPDIAEQMCNLLDIKELAAKLNQVDVELAEETCEWISTLHNIVNTQGELLWDLLDKKTLAQELSRSWDIVKTSACIRELTSTKREWARIFCSEFNDSDLALILNKIGDTPERSEFLEVLKEANPSVYSKLLELLD